MFAVAAVGLIVPDYIVYLSGVKTGRTRPHPITWTTLTVLSATAAGILAADSGWGAWPLGITAALNATIATQAWANRPSTPRPVVDVTSLVVATSAAAVWLTAGSRSAAATMLGVASLAAFVPTVSKAWTDPWSEPVAKYLLSAVRYACVVAAVAVPSYATVAYPVLWVAVNAGFAVVVLFRRATARNRLRPQMPSAGRTAATGQHLDRPGNGSHGTARAATDASVLHAGQATSVVGQRKVARSG